MVAPENIPMWGRHCACGFSSLASSVPRSAWIQLIVMGCQKLLPHRTSSHHLTRIPEKMDSKYTETYSICRNRLKCIKHIKISEIIPKMPNRFLHRPLRREYWSSQDRSKTGLGLHVLSNAPDGHSGVVYPVNR